MKKVLIILLCFVLITAISGCKNSTAETENPSTDETMNEETADDQPVSISESAASLVTEQISVKDISLKVPVGAEISGDDYHTGFKCYDETEKEIGNITVMYSHEPLTEERADYFWSTYVISSATNEVINKTELNGVMVYAYRAEWPPEYSDNPAKGHIMFALNDTFYLVMTGFRVEYAYYFDELVDSLKWNG